MSRPASSPRPLHRGALSTWRVRAPRSAPHLNARCWSAPEHEPPGSLSKSSPAPSSPRWASPKTRPCAPSPRAERVAPGRDGATAPMRRRCGRPAGSSAGTLAAHARIGAFPSGRAERDEGPLIGTWSVSSPSPRRRMRATGPLVSWPGPCASASTGAGGPSGDVLAPWSGGDHAPACRGTRRDRSCTGAFTSSALRRSRSRGPPPLRPRVPRRRRAPSTRAPGRRRPGA